MDNQTYHRMERLRGQLVAAAMRKETFLHSGRIHAKPDARPAYRESATEKAKP